MIPNPSQLIISQLFIYPIKSLGGISLQQSQVTSRGLQYDRRFMLVDENNRFVSQREFPLMALLKLTIEGDRLIVYTLTDDQNRFVIPLNVASGDEITVQIWDDTCLALLVDKQADEWFSARLGRRVRLVYMPEKSKRYVDEDYALKNDLTSFSDGFPILIIGQASLDDLNNRLELPVGMDRFRPNLVFSGGTPFMEDGFRHFQCGVVNLFAVKPCARCSMTTNDPLTAVVGQEPLKTLSGFRKGNNKIYFGQNVLVGNEGMLSLGDELKIIDTKLPDVVKS
jgi:hypothetical protein